MDKVSFRLGFLSDDDKERFLWLALAGEVGEGLNIVKKKWRDGYTETRLYELKLELADVYIYLRVLENFYGMDLDKAAAEKMTIVEKGHLQSELLHFNLVALIPQFFFGIFRRFNSFYQVQGYALMSHSLKNRSGKG